MDLRTKQAADRHPTSEQQSTMKKFLSGESFQHRNELSRMWTSWIFSQPSAFVPHGRDLLYRSLVPISARAWWEGVPRSVRMYLQQMGLCPWFNGFSRFVISLEVELGGLPIQTKTPFWPFLSQVPEPPRARQSGRLRARSGPVSQS